MTIDTNVDSRHARFVWRTLRPFASIEHSQPFDMIQVRQVTMAGTTALQDHVSWLNDLYDDSSSDTVGVVAADEKRRLARGQKVKEKCQDQAVEILSEGSEFPWQHLLRRLGF